MAIEGKTEDYSVLLRPLFFLQIKEKLLQLTEKRKEMIDKWEDRWEWLRLSKDIHTSLIFLLFWVSMESMQFFVLFFFFNVILLLNDFKVLDVFLHPLLAGWWGGE